MSSSRAPRVTRRRKAPLRPVKATGASAADNSEMAETDILPGSEKIVKNLSNRFRRLTGYSEIAVPAAAKFGAGLPVIQTEAATSVVKVICSKSTDLSALPGACVHAFQTAYLAQSSASGRTES